MPLQEVSREYRPAAALRGDAAQRRDRCYVCCCYSQARITHEAFSHPGVPGTHLAPTAGGARGVHAAGLRCHNATVRPVAARPAGAIRQYRGGRPGHRAADAVAPGAGRRDTAAGYGSDDHRAGARCADGRGRHPRPKSGVHRRRGAVCPAPRAPPAGPCLPAGGARRPLPDSLGAGRWRHLPAAAQRARYQLLPQQPAPGVVPGAGHRRPAHAGAGLFPRPPAAGLVAGAAVGPARRRRPPPARPPLPGTANWYCAPSPTGC